MKSPTKLVGIVRRKDIISAYNHSISKRAHKQHKAVLLSHASMDKTNLLCVKIPSRAMVVGKKIGTIGLPENCLIVSLRRGNKFSVPKGDTILHTGDMLELYGLTEKLKEGVVLLTQKGTTDRRQ